MKFRIIFLTFLFFLHSPLTVLAHATEPRLEINIDRIIPGGIIDVRGVAFDYEETVTLTLIVTQGELPLGEVVADTEGVFLHIITLPADLAEGTYYFRGVTTHHYAISPALTVQGNAIPAEGEGQEERWEEEEYLPYAIPTYPPGVVPGVVTSSAPVVSMPAEELPGSSGLGTNKFVMTALLLVVIILMFGILRRRLR